MAENATPIKIAILLNGSSSISSSLTIKSFESAITAASAPDAPTPIIDFYDLVITHTYPHPNDYHLFIIITATADAMDSDTRAAMQENIPASVRLFPKLKMLGISGGHQIVAEAFGATVGNMEGAEIGVTEVQLTAKGKEMFPFVGDWGMRIHEFHRRQVEVPAHGFVALAERNQAFVNEANTILTFQGHPELNPELARFKLDAAPSYMGVDEERKEHFLDKLGGAHDGLDIWRRILAWTKE